MEKQQIEANQSYLGKNGKWFLISLAVLALLAILFFRLSERKELVRSSSSAVQSTASDMNISRSMEVVAADLQAQLRKKALGFESDLVKMSKEVSYKESSATLVRQYSWEAGFPITIGMSGTEVKWDENRNKFLINIRKLKVGQRFSIGAKQASTLSSSGWKDESSKDADFWEEIVSLTKTKIKADVFDNKAVTNQLRSRATTCIINEINKILEGSEMEDFQIEAVILEVGY
jgi:alpha-tubulin suppressor-like RCC1 family protein